MEGQKGNGLFAKGFKGWWWGACGAVGIGTGTWAVLSSIPEGACACGAEGPMASIGPLALGAKGCVERLRPIGETTHYDLCVALLLQIMFAVHARGASNLSPLRTFGPSGR